jgi:hypothetical protein
LKPAYGGVAKRFYSKVDTFLMQEHEFFLSASVPNVGFFSSESDLSRKTPVPVVTTAGSLPAAVVIYSSLFSLTVVK